MQQPAQKKQRKHWHSIDAAKCSSKTDPKGVQFSAGSLDRSCNHIAEWHASVIGYGRRPRHYATVTTGQHPPVDFEATCSDGWGRIATTPRFMGDELGPNWPPNALLEPCAPEADPATWAGAGARWKSVGHWIDAALADEGWWRAENLKRAEQSIWGGIFQDSGEPFEALLVGAAASAQ